MGIFDFFKKKKKEEPKRIIDTVALGLNPLFEDAARMVAQTSFYSILYLQRKLKIGYNQAERIEEELEYAGIIGPIIEPMVPREILITDEKKLEDVLLSIQENGLLPDGMVHTIANEEIKRTPQGL
jgi:DNA segregation ATPase FtsK/SpoIIIE-like protein